MNSTRLDIGRVTFAAAQTDALLRALRPLLWLTLGVSATFVYLYGPPFAGADLGPIGQLPDPLYPSQAVILTVLLLTPRRWWWLYLLVYFVLQFVQAVWNGLPAGYAATSNIANVLEPLVGAFLIRRFVPSPLGFARLQEVGLYVGCVVAAAAIGATWGSVTMAAQGSPLVASWIGWFLADVLASLILAPTLLLWLATGIGGLYHGLWTRRLEAAALTLTLLLLGVLAFGIPTEPTDAAPAFLFLPVSALLWAAVRFGSRGVATALSFTTVLAIVGAANEVGPFAGRSAEASVVTIQAFLLGLGVPLLCLAALVQEREQTRRRLQLSEQRYRSVVSNLPNATVLLFGGDLRHLFADGGGLTSLGLSAAAVEGGTPWQVFPLEIASVIGPHYQAALDGSETAVELTHYGRTYHAHLLPLNDAGHQIGMVLMQDITDRRRAQALADLDRAKTEFFSNVSHEFRTPLTLVLGPLQEAARTAESPLQRDLLRVAERNARGLLRLTNTLLDFARIEAGRVDATYAPVDLPRLTSDLAGAFRSAIEMAGLQLVVDCPPLPEGPEVYVDRYLWEQVVLNLLSNALKFTESGEIRVQVRASADAAQVQLRVRDTGVGIPSDELPRLFERFHRIRGQPARTREGSGLGLALVYEVIKLHGGTITAISEVGSGTEFVVTIPTGRAHLPDERVQLRHEPDSAGSSAGAFVDDARRWSEPPPPYEPGNGASAGHDERTPRVLVVDDNADIRQYLARLLGGAYRVESAPDGESALRMVQSNPPDLIIADIMMPRMDGLALLRAIRQDPRSQALPFVLLSARAGEEARVEGIAAGADDYLVKPFSARELLARISGHLALQEGRERLLEAERIARADAEAALALAGRASGRAVWAQQVTALLAAAGTLQEIAAAVIQRKLPIGGAASGTLLVRSDDPDILTVVALTDHAHGLEHANQRVAASAEWPGAEAVRTGQSLWIESATAASGRFPEWSLRTGSQAVAALPLVAQERTIGSLTFEFKTEHVFAPEERALLLTVASQCAAAVQRVRLHAAADRARGHAEAGLRLRDDFLRSLAHDLKTPLASLLWNVQILSNNARAGAIERATFASGLANIEASAREVMANIDEISDLVRAQAGEALALHVERVELVDLVSEVVGTHGDLADHTVRIVAAEPSVWVECDRTCMQRVMGNLLDNALKYSARGTEVVITLGRGERDARTWAVARVEDHGVGIPPADLELVFDRYYRGANVVDSTVGQGIGLASARQLVEEHGGLLTFESTEGVGSTFTVWLPMTAVGPERDAAGWITV